MTIAAQHLHQPDSRIPYEACPLCSAREFGPLVRGDCSRHPLYHPVLSRSIVWMQCSACRHVFTDGYFTEEAARLVFSKTNESQKVGAGLEQQRHVSARMIERVLPWVSEGFWLDIGFGNASLLLTAREFGFVPVGVDLRQDNVRQLAALGVEAHGIDVRHLDHPGRYAVVSMADVLEHMPFPKEGLVAAQRLLADGGLLFVSMPNSDSALWAQWNRLGTNPYWGELEHFHNFGRARLYALLEEFGFTPLRFGVSERYRCCMEVVAKKR